MQQAPKCTQAFQMALNGRLIKSTTHFKFYKVGVMAGVAILPGDQELPPTHFGQTTMLVPFLHSNTFEEYQEVA